MTLADSNYSTINKPKPKIGPVSVVIPAYNGERFILETLEQVVKQTLLPAEIVVVDDGSQDSTPAIVEEFVKTAPVPLRLVRQPNGGTQAARNTGIQHATGRFVALLDQDDLWQLTFLEEMTTAWEQAGQAEAIIYCNYQVVDSRMKMLGTPRAASFAMPELLLSSEAAPSTFLFPRDVFDKVGLLDPAFLTSGDWDWWLRAVLAGIPFVHLDRTLVLYRVHSGNTTRQIEKVLDDHAGILSRVFARPDLPANLRRIQTRIMAADQLCRAYTYCSLAFQNEGQPEGREFARRSRQALAEALKLYPSWNFIPIVLSAFARNSLQGRYIGSPVWVWDDQARGRMQLATDFAVQAILESNEPALRPFQKKGRLRAYGLITVARLLMQYRPNEAKQAIPLLLSGLLQYPLAPVDKVARVRLWQRLRKQSWLEH